MKQIIEALIVYAIGIASLTACAFVLNEYYHHKTISEPQVSYTEESYYTAMNKCVHEDYRALYGKYKRGGFEKCTKVLQGKEVL